LNEYQIVPASIRHIRPMSRHIRAAACITLQGFGFEPRVALRRAFVASSYCRTAIIDGKAGAMWGVKATLLGDTAFVWLVLSDEITKMPMSIVREAKAELAKIMAGYREIAITVLPDDIAAIRFAVALGFHDRDNDDGGMSRKQLTDAIMADPRYKVPVGDSYAIALGYHPTFGHP
jgi:hypothetical protein